MCLVSSVEVVARERSCLLQSCITQILSGGSLCEKSCVDAIVEIFLYEGRDVEQWLEPRNISQCLRLIHFLLLSLSLSYFVHCFILSYHIHAWFVCMPHLYLTTRASYSTSTLIQRNQEELVQSPSPKIRLLSLVTLSVLQLSFNFHIIVHRLAVHLFTPL